jgi:hypothetical protein
MNMISWNCRGLGNLRAVLALHNLVKSQGPKILFLMETKLDVREMEFIRIKLRFKFCFTVPSLGRSGGLALLWTDDVQLTILNYSINHIDAQVCLQGALPWRFTGFYGNSITHRRRESWALLDKLDSMMTLPWLLMGDFSEILSSDERSGESVSSQRPMFEFGEVLLVDLGYRGYPFTWDNGRDAEAFIQKRLDRAVASVSWMTMFPLCTLDHIQSSYSDHVPILLHTELGSNQVCKRRRPRKFEEKWSIHPECEKIIQRVWDQVNPVGSPMYVVCEKIKQCREELFRWYKGISSEFQEKIRGKTIYLSNLVAGNSMGVNNDVIVAIKQEINHLLLSEELHWRQRSRMVWLEAGDQNTKFFHNYANQRQRTNGIQGLRNPEDVWCTAENQVEDIAVNYFRNIFTTSHPTRIGETLSAVETVVSEETNQRLLQPFTPEEVRTALVQMHPSKAPGADGMPSFFYQKYWHIVGTSVTSAVLSVLNSGKILRKINLTYLSLIPKKKEF